MRSARWWGIWAICAGLYAAPAVWADSAWSVHVWRITGGTGGDRVTGLTIMPDGYLWVASYSGLARFDGYRFESFSSTQFYPTPTSEGILNLAPDPNGLRILINHGPLASLNNHGQPTVVCDTLPNRTTVSMVEDNSGVIWLSYVKDWVYRVQPAGSPGGKPTVTVFTDKEGLPGGASECNLCRDNSGRIWFAKNGKLGWFADGKFQMLLQVGDRVAMGPARAGGIWVCGHNQLFRYDGHARQDAAPVNSVNTYSTPSVVLEDSKGAIWIGTVYNGLFRYEAGATENIPTSDRQITGLAEDSDGDIWVGTRDGGLNRVCPRAVVVEGAQTGLPFSTPQSICQDTNGTLWAASQDGSLLVRKANTWVPIFNDATWPGGAVMSVAAGDHGTVWFGTRDRRIYRWSDNHFTPWTVAQGVKGSMIRTLLVTRNGDLWIGEEGLETIQVLHNDQLMTIPYPGRPGNIHAMAQDTAGTIWMGTLYGDLMRSDGYKLVTVPTPMPYLHRSIRCIYPTDDGSIWIGYDGAIARIKNGVFSAIGHSKGLSENSVTEITDDGHGWLWIGGADYGVFRVSRKELDAVADGTLAQATFIHYGGDEDVPELHATAAAWPGAIRAIDGRIWMPMGTALVVITPDNVRQHLTPPKVLVKQITIDGKPVAGYGGLVPVNGLLDLDQAGVQLTLPPQRLRIQFDFTALTLNASENVQFKYRLEGFDDNWLDAGTQRSVVYSSLSPGNYHFHVIACNSDGVWNEAGSSVGMTIEPFIWQRWWFITSAVVLFTSIVVMIARYVSFRRLRFKLRHLERQAALDKERARIARDLHDDLGGRLTEIMLLSELETQDRIESGEADGRVLQIASSARLGIKSLDETVWAVNPRNDTVPHMINYIAQFTVKFLQAAGIRCRVDLPDNPPERPVPADVRHNVFLVVKESLNNIVRHAAAEEVWLRASTSDQSLNLSIEDDGRGFDMPPDDPNADGLRNMRERVGEIGGRFELQSRQGMGTRIRIDVPWESPK